MRSFTLGVSLYGLDRRVLILITLNLLSRNESDWRQIRILQIDAKFKGHLLKETLVNTQSMSPVWSPDGKVSDLS